MKASAYRQSWPQNRLSKIEFGIARKRSWYADTNQFDEQTARSANLYVFCVFTEKDEKLARIRVRDVSAWRFYVLSTEMINQQFGGQRKVALSRIEELTDPVEYDDLKARIDHVIGS